MPIPSTNTIFGSYNVHVAAPKNSSILKLESIGLILIGILALLFILIRYWHYIAWSAR